MEDKIHGQVQTGDFCEIHLHRSAEETRTYQTRVELIESSKLIFVQIPTYKTKMVKLPQTAKYDIIFKNDKVIYKYSMEIVGYAKIDNELYLKIGLTSEGEKVQRRKFFRLTISKPIYIKEPTNLENSEKIYVSEVRDLSAGGIRFVTNQLFSKDKIVNINFMLDAEYYSLNANIIFEKDLKEISDKYAMEYRAEFSDVSQLDRDRLVANIFEAQRAKMNRTYGR